MALVRRGSRVRYVVPYYLIVLTWGTEDSAREKLKQRALSNGFDNVQVTDTGGFGSPELTIEAYTSTDFGSERDVEGLLHGMVMAEGFRPVEGMGRFNVLSYASYSSPEQPSGAWYAPPTNSNGGGPSDWPSEHTLLFGAAAVLVGIVVIKFVL